MEDRLTNIIRKIDLASLHKLVGKVILKAIKTVNSGEDEKALAEILILKHGTLLLNNKEIRIGIINSLSLSEAGNLCKNADLSPSKDFKAYEELINYFGYGYNIFKSKLFVDFLEVTSLFYYKPINDNREAKEIISAKFGEEIKILGYLHDYQKRVKDEVMSRLNHKFEKSFFVQMPTGAGKTYTALECVTDLMRKPRLINENQQPIAEKFIVWLVDKNELAEQALVSFKKLWKIRGDHEINAFRLFKDFQPDFIKENGGVVFAGFDKLYSILNNPNHTSFQSVKHLITNTDLLIIDEAHHSIAETYFTCINQFRDVPFIKIMGLSATPGSKDYETTQSLISLYSSDKISIRNSNWEPIEDVITYLQQGGYLATLKTQLLETGASSNENSEDRVLDDLASNSERNRKILDQIKLADEAKESTVVFACTLDHVYALLILCRSIGINAKYIIGDIEQADRIDILNEFKEKKYNILINLDILSTGIDLPNINKVIIARPINSPNLISQILGRALRGPKNGGNSLNTIINIKDNLINFPGTSFLYNYYQGSWDKI
ncbi:MAG: DEAD/DEAH box helicase family protein [Pelobium sp.]